MLKRRTLWALVLFPSISIALFVFTLDWSASEKHRLSADFTAYYTAATIVARGAGGHLYEVDVQRQVQQEVAYPHSFRNHGLLGFEYPPFSVLPVLPLASLPVHLAYYLWGGVNLILFGATLYLLARSNPNLRSDNPTFVPLCLAACAFLPVFAGLVLGQLTFLMLFFLSAGYWFLLRHRDISAGIALSGLAMKPQLIVVLPLLLFMKGRWRALLGMAMGLAGLSLTSLVVVGPFDLLQYLAFHREISDWLPVTLNLTWLGFFSDVLALWPSLVYPATFAADCLSLYMLWAAWRGPWSPETPRFRLQLAFTLLVSMVVTPHLYPHDTMLLIPVAFLAADYLIAVGVNRMQRVMAAVGSLVVYGFAFVDSYPMVTLPVRPVFVAIVLLGIWVLGVIKGSQPDSAIGGHGASAVVAREGETIARIGA